MSLVWKNKACGDEICFHSAFKKKIILIFRCCNLLPSTWKNTVFLSVCKKIEQEKKQLKKMTVT